MKASLLPCCARFLGDLLVREQRMVFSAVFRSRAGLAAGDAGMLGVAAL